MILLGFVVRLPPANGSHLLRCERHVVQSDPVVQSRQAVPLSGMLPIGVSCTKSFGRVSGPLSSCRGPTGCS